MVWNCPTSFPEELKEKNFWAYCIDDGYLIFPVTRGFMERVQRCSYEPYNLDFVSHDHQNRRHLVDCVISDDYGELCSHFMVVAKEQIRLMEAKSRILKSEILKLQNKVE